MNKDLNIDFAMHGDITYGLIKDLHLLDEASVNIIYSFFASRAYAFFYKSTGKFEMRNKMSSNKIEHIFRHLGFNAIASDQTPNKKGETVYFGKYKGRLWKDVPLNYLIWCRDNLDGGMNMKCIARELERRGVDV